jgi:hypothetical protein
MCTPHVRIRAIDVKDKSILKGSDDGVMHFEESFFGTLPIVQCFSLKTTFRKLALLPSSGKKGGGVTPTLWGPLERATLNHWIPSQQRSKTCQVL